jgi:hypothetical protein
LLTYPASLPFCHLSYPNRGISYQFQERTWLTASWMKHNIEIVNGSIEYFLILAIQQQEEDVDGEWIVMSRKIDIFHSQAI